MVDPMILLFESTETEFSTNGLGSLSDALSCKVTEERNGSFELEMTYPVSGRRYADLSLRRIIFSKPNPIDDPQPFRIYQITRPMKGRVKVYAAHISYDLSGIPVPPFIATSLQTALYALKNYAVVANPFTFYSDKSTIATMTVTAPSSIRTLLGGTEGSILDIYGGEYKFDRYDVRLYNARGRNRGVTIRYGKNLTDLEQDEQCSNVYTGVYPYWSGQFDQQDVLVTLPEEVLKASGTYTFARILPLDLSSNWMEPPTVTQLRNAANNYMETNNIGVPKVSLEVSFVPLEQSEEYKDLALLERVELCDTVNVEFPEMGVSATAKCVRTVYDALIDRYDSVELGDAKSSLATTIVQKDEEREKENEEIKTRMQKAVENATKWITNGNGYIVALLNDDGTWKELCSINDRDEYGNPVTTPSINTATKVWRWNNGGFGFSSHGYNGPYELALTADGAIVADRITAGTLDATVIRAGILQNDRSLGQDEVFYLDLDSGVLRMNATSLSVQAKPLDEFVDETANDILNDFKEGYLKDLEDELQNQTDKKAETWYQATDPSTNWTTQTQKNEHIGDLWYDTRDNHIYMYTGSGWTEASAPKEVFDAIDGKAQIFVGSNAPNPPYYVGDLWFQSSSSGIKVCITTRETGGYRASDWDKRDNYIDQAAANSAASAAVEAQSQMDIYNKLAGKYPNEGLYIENGHIYFNASYIKTGSLLADLIISGKITSKNGKVYFDLDNNELRCDRLVSTGTYVNIANIVASISRRSLGSGQWADGLQIYNENHSDQGITISPGVDDTPSISVGEYNTPVGLTLSALVTDGAYSSASHIEMEDSGIVKLYAATSSLTAFQPGMITLYPAHYGNVLSGHSGKMVLQGQTIDLYGGVTIHGGFTITAGTKSRSIDTENYDTRLLYCYEMPSPMFGDIGEGETDDSGECYVFLDDVFAETIAADIEYQVFLQKEGPGDIWVDEKKPGYFVVRGTKNLRFAWELKAKQSDYVHERLERPKNNTEDSIDYEWLYEEEHKKLITEQEEILYETT